MSFETAALGVIGLVPMVLGIVEAAKRAGIEGKGSFFLALGVGFVFASYLEALAQGLIPAVVQPYVNVLVVGIAGALAVTGLYDLGTGRNR